MHRSERANPAGSGGVPVLAGPGGLGYRVGRVRRAWERVSGALPLSDSRLLVAVSSPWASEKLMHPIEDLARRLDAEVVIAHVTTLQDEDESESDAAERGKQTLTLMTGHLADRGIPAEGVMLFSDDTVKAILNTAEAKKCTVIILGLTGKGVLRRLIAGDVPGNLIRQTPLPVLLCPANWSGTL